MDFNEAQVKAMLDRSRVGSALCRWVNIGTTNLGIKMNWVSFALAASLTWSFAIVSLVDENSSTYFGDGKQWVAQNFTWLYIGTQDVWCALLIYLCFSRFGSIKLGRDDEKPRYNDFVWFSMLFTCGVAVGLYVFGVSEPLYFYRASWTSLGTKIAVQNDAQRANQAIFMSVYHWGIHGWVPYILLALSLGIVSFRWGMPPAIRSCFYPLFGDHALGLFGDIIDGLSCATTTFGVCTSLGLGVSQLASGLRFIKNISCKVKENCQDAGGVWRLDTSGADLCYVSNTSLTVFPGSFFDTTTNMTVTNYDDCAAGWLATPDGKQDANYTIIALVTLLATLSVLSGIDRGIKYLAAAAITCGFIVMFLIFLSDNTWFILNVMVQSTGYYLQYVIQVGFDCEAFQQLNWEMSTTSNFLWGSTGEDSMAAKVLAAGNTNAGSASAYFGDSDKGFMDWWTIFYWAWWITWAPFVGFFVALISRGRTVREVIIGGFVCPTLYAIIWFSVFGGLAIKMERTAELALGVMPNNQGISGTVDCSGHYSSGSPITPAAKKLADEGYYMLTCMPWDDQIYYLMQPYENRTQFIHFFLWVGLVIYFLTSSDSGSMTDDIITASGLSAHRIPWWQKVFWCCTEGAVAMALVHHADALRNLQKLSIIIGLPYTFFLCLMCPSLYRALKREAGDQDLITSHKFNTQLFDIMELFSPKGGSPCTPGTHVKSLLTGLLLPAIPLKAVFDKVYPSQPMANVATAIFAQLFWLVWIVFEGLENNLQGVHIIGWLFFLFFAFTVMLARIEMRRNYGVYGSWMDDFFATLLFYPFVLAQLAMELEVNADGSHPGPKYFASVEELEKDLAAVASTEDSKPISMTSVKFESTEPSVVVGTAAA